MPRRFPSSTVSAMPNGASNDAFARSETLSDPSKANTWEMEPTSLQLKRNRSLSLPWRKSSLRGIVHRASVSIRGLLLLDNARRHRSTETYHDEVAQDSGLESSKILELGPATENSQSSCLPVPGHGSEPPVIPRHSGAAAKAAAAANAHGELCLAFHPATEPFDYSVQDMESGIGINMGSDDDQDELVAKKETDNIKVDFLAALPAELALHVCSMLGGYDLLVARLVSRTWNSIIQSQHVWRDLCMRDIAQTVAADHPVRPGDGSGVPHSQPDTDWKKVYEVAKHLDNNWKDGAMVATHLTGHSDSIYCVQFDESKIITGSRDRTIRIWDMHTLECKLIIGPPDVISRPDIFLNDRGNPTHCVVRDGRPIKTSLPASVSFPIFHNASILCLQYDDQILVTGSSDSTCIVYNVSAGYRPIRRLKHHEAAVLDLVFDHKHIVTCSKDVNIGVWDRLSGNLLRVFRGHSGPVNAVQVLGNTVVSCSGDLLVKIWDIQAGKLIRELKGHTKGLACSQISQDGRYIASAGNDRTIRIWNAHTGECLHEVVAHNALVRSLHIDSINGRLISASYDHDIKVWDLETGRLLLELPKWHLSWVLAARSDYRRIVSTGQDAKILIMDFGAAIPNIEILESMRSMQPGLNLATHRQVSFF